MKNFFTYFYVFSKLTISSILLICLIGTLYILYLNYQKEDIISNNQINIETELQKNININSELINSLSSELKLTQSTLKEINENIKSISNQNNNKDFSNLNESIKNLNDNFNLLSSEIENIKNENSKVSIIKTPDQDQIFNSNKNKIIKLILLKYENNLIFDQELEYLKTTLSQKNKIEKLLVLSTKKFKGYDYLNSIFNKELNSYLKKIINKKPDSFFSKIILPYIEVSPSSENKLNDDLILKIKEIKINLDNRDIENAFKIMKNINDYENIFKLSSNEIIKYLDFKNELIRLK